MSADTPGAIARRCHELVWQTRHELEEFWSTPSWQHALLFAFTEAGEAVDAYLRQFGHYARNNERDMSVAAELADCAMMLLSAIQRQWNEQMTRAVDDQVWAYGERTDMERAMREVAYQVGGTLATGSTHGILMALAAVLAVPGLDLEAELVRRLERIRARHVAHST
ncbi:MAG: hypothetical protein KatS3mg051_1159 [Anaerolineae bacterium]|nr:MAG: hypothetical protein KatS3mg051_1159 [Anaerolineae bacterium]